jgi:hypothetical protein
LAVLIKAWFWTSNIEARPPNNDMKCSDGAPLAGWR